MQQLDMFEELKPMIYESPDHGTTVYAREFGSDPSTRVIVQTALQKQWEIRFSEDDRV